MLHYEENNKNTKNGKARYIDARTMLAQPPEIPTHVRYSILSLSIEIYRLFHESCVKVQ